MQKNQNNRVHGKKPGKAEFQIERLLPVGKENAVTTAELVKRSGCSSARELQQKIAYERNHGAVICSGSGKGYWKPKNRQDCRILSDNGRKSKKHICSYQKRKESAKDARRAAGHERRARRWRIDECFQRMWCAQIDSLKCLHPHRRYIFNLV